MAWARLERTQKYLLPAAAAFVVPTSISIGLVGAIVYHLFDPAAQDPNYARTALTLFTVCCGLVILPFVEWQAGEPIEPSPWLAGLAGVMSLLLVASLVIEPVRNFYELRNLASLEYAAVAAAVGIWAVTLYGAGRLATRVWKPPPEPEQGASPASAGEV